MRFPARFIVAAAALLLFFTTGCTRNPAKQRAKYLQSAGNYMTAQRYQEAIIQYRNTLQFEPSSAEILSRLGDAYFHNEQYQDAYLAYQKAGEADPSYLPAQLALARISLAAQKYTDAQHAAEEILRQHEDSLDAHIVLANSLAGQKELDHGIQVLQEVIASHPDYIPAYLNAGIFYAAQGNMDKARAQFEKALTIDPNSLPARKAIASYYMTQGNLARAEQNYRAAVDSHPDSVEARLSLAQFYIEQHRDADAEAIYKDLIRIEHNSVESRFILAKFYIFESRLEEAARLDRELVSQSPDFLPAQLQLAELDFQQKRLDDADLILNRILKNDPGNSQALTTRARVWLERKQPEKAIKDLETVQHQDPNLPSTHYLLGAAYAQMGELDRAQSSFEQAIGLNSSMVEAYAAMAEMMLDRGQSQSALQYALQILEIDPKRADSHLFLGSAYANLRDYSKAESEFQQYCTLEPSSPLGFIRLGYLYLMEKKLVPAEKQFQNALSINAKNIEAFSGLVLALRLQGRGSQAIARIQAALAQGESAELYALLGKTYMDVGQYSLAEQSLQRALQMDPGKFGIYVDLGTLYARQNSAQKAATQFENAIRLNPKSVGLWTTLGMLRQILNQNDLAEKAYEKALEIDPGAGVAANNLAWLYTENGGDASKAFDLATRAKLALPDTPSVSDTLGWVYYKRDLYASAIPLLQEAVRQEPDHAMFHFHLAAALLRSGKKEQAKKELNGALHLDENLRKQSEVQQILNLM